MLPVTSLSREELEEEVLRLRLEQQTTSDSRQTSFAKLFKLTRDLWLPHAVERRAAGEVSALEFARDYVAQSTPLVLTDLDRTFWPCLGSWHDDEYLLRKLGDAKVSVNVTPDGRADSVNEAGEFVKPLEEQISFHTFWHWLRGTGNDIPTGVPYLSRQNDSLREEFSSLIGDVPASVPLAVEAFGNDPEAVNLWIGDDRSVSSCHKDHYENLYIVVRGEKIFTLLPPAAVPFLHERPCAPATYRRTDAGLEAVLDSPPSSENLQDAWLELGGGQSVPWIPFDVAERQDQTQFPQFAQFGKRLAVEVRVLPGEMLYLPATWYHRVAQRGLTIAVNYWHDMPFGHAYVHHMFLRSICGFDTDADLSDGEEDSNQPTL